MTTSTFYAGTSDGVVRSYHSTYAAARKGTGYLSTSTGATYEAVGQYLTGDYYCYELFFDFDTSAIPDTDTIDSVTFSLWLYYDESYADFTVQVRAFDWGATLENADWRSGDPADSNSLDEYTLLATKSTTPTWSTSGYTAFASESAFVSNINKTGSTRVVVNGSRHLAGNTPSGNERVSVWMANEAEPDERRPKLVVVHTAAGGGDVTDPMGMSGFFGA